MMCAQDSSFASQKCESTCVHTCMHIHMHTNTCTHGIPMLRGQGPSRPGAETDLDNHTPPHDHACLGIDRCLTHCVPTRLWAPCRQGQQLPSSLLISLITQQCAWEQKWHSTSSTPAQRGTQRTAQFPNSMPWHPHLRELKLVPSSVPDYQPIIPQFLITSPHPSVLQANEGELEIKEYTSWAKWNKLGAIAQL